MTGLSLPRRPILIAMSASTINAGIAMAPMAAMRTAGPANAAMTAGEAAERRESLKRLATKQELLLMHATLTALLREIIPSGSGQGRLVTYPPPAMVTSRSRSCARTCSALALNPAIAFYHPNPLVTCFQVQQDTHGQTQLHPERGHPESQTWEAATKRRFEDAPGIPA